MATQTPRPDARDQDPRDVDVEADEADLAEQRRAVTEGDEPQEPAPRALDEEADEADLLEQEREVGDDDEDYPPA